MEFRRGWRKVATCYIKMMGSWRRLWSYNGVMRYASECCKVKWSNWGCSMVVGLKKGCRKMVGYEKQKCDRRLGRTWIV